MYRTLVAAVAAFSFIFHVKIVTKTKQEDQIYHVSCPVTNLVSVPFEYVLSAPVGERDVPHLLAQLLYNEPVTVIKQEHAWCKVSAPSLTVFTQDKYVPLRGWIKTNDLHKKEIPDPHGDAAALICTAAWTPVYKKVSENPDKFQHVASLSYDTRVQGLVQESEWWKIGLVDGKDGWIPAPCVVDRIPSDEAGLRAMVVAHARQFLGFPYCWGGCSAYSPSKKKSLTGFDCSGLVYRIFHAIGKTVPRNSRSQFAFATPREFADLQPGDVIFLSVPKYASKISHVMLYVGDGKLIEAWSARTAKNAMNVQPIHEVSVEERLGKPLAEIKNGEQVGCYRCYGGTFF